MKTLEDFNCLKEILDRLIKVTPESNRLWGTMTPQEMLCHLADSTECAFGRGASASTDSAFKQALFSLLIAHFNFADERITPRKLVGLILGFLGVVVLTNREASTTKNTHSLFYLLGQLAVVAASLCYAIGGTYSRKVMQQRLGPLRFLPEL